MGRHPKKVGQEQGVDRRESGYYATPDFVAEFIAGTLLKLNPRGCTALDPCVGKGELAIPLLQRSVDVDGMDILPFPVPPGTNLRVTDFLDFYRDRKSERPAGQNIELPYDFYVANPPYNCHESEYIRQRKPELRRLFGKVGVHNMYSMFLSALVDCAKPGALIGVITFDSFLTARVHAELRRQILGQCALHYLLLCPTDLFRDQGADVRTCVMILQKDIRHQGRVTIGDRPPRVSQFRQQLRTRQFGQVDLEQIVLAGEGDRSEFVLDVPHDVRSLFDDSRLGDAFRCVTGISTGNDQLYLSPSKRPGFSQPFFKNPGARKFYCPPNAWLTDDFLELEKSIPNFMVRNKDILYQAGITCSSMGVPFSACYLPQCSTFGVNANIILHEQDCWWLIAYLNSHLATYLVRGILNRSNMVTSGYVSRIPLPAFRRPVRRRLAEVARTAYHEQVLNGSAEACVNDVNRIVERELGLPDETVHRIRRFASDLVRTT